MWMLSVAQRNSLRKGESETHEMVILDIKIKNIKLIRVLKFLRENALEMKWIPVSLFDLKCISTDN